MALWSFFCILGGNPLSQSLAMLALVVWDYDEAIDYFTRCLRFTLLEDTDRGNGKRWVVVAPTGSSGAMNT
jgi:hypothetical protein